MPEGRERREVPRIAVAARPLVRVRGLRRVHLLDLSQAGAQIEHLGLLRLGAPCALDLPAPFWPHSLPAAVIWCMVMGRERKHGGESHLVVRSGLKFAALTEGQETALAATLKHFAAAL